MLVYTAQKQVIKYQKNAKRIILMIKNIINLIIIQFLILFESFSAFIELFSFFNSKIFFSDKESVLIIILTALEIKEE